MSAATCVGSLLMDCAEKSPGRRRVSAEVQEILPLQPSLSPVSRDANNFQMSRASVAWRAACADPEEGCREVNGDR